MPPGPPAIVFDNVRYVRSSDGCFKRARGSAGEHWLLHRAIWAASNGPIPPGWDVTFIDGDKDHLAVGNLRGAPRSRRRPWSAAKLKRSYQQFQGIRYFLDSDGYYKAPGSGAEHRLLHRAVWAHHHGPIPPGWHIHHRDEDRANNHVSNLIGLSAADHLSGEHGYARGAWAED